MNPDVELPLEHGLAILVAGEDGLACFALFAYFAALSNPHMVR